MTQIQIYTISDSPDIALASWQRKAALFVLILAGEAIFFLPFVLPRIFKPTFLAVFDITNFELGTFFSVYGLIAIPAYLFGGPLADRFPPHGLMSIALLSTTLGGWYLYTIPEISGMFYVYGFWGLTTIFLFWASLMRTTRVLGGVNSQGLAFGLLDGGRGLVAALIGLLAVGLLSDLFPADGASVDAASRQSALQQVILFFTLTVSIAALLVFMVLRRIPRLESLSDARLDLSSLRQVMVMPSVWLQALIILCAYSGYRVADDVSLLASDVLGYTEVEAAGVGTLSLWLRPVAAIGAGLMADRVSTSKMVLVSFALMIIGGLAIAFGPMDHLATWMVFIGIVSTSLGVYAMRGLYFAIMQEGEIPIWYTGTAVGLASIIGYLPDIYMAPLMGIFLDNYPGLQGHRYVFMLLIGFASVGALVTLAFRRHMRKVQVMD